MIYKNASDWLNAPQKHVLFFGMSGLGKTYLSNMLRDAGNWFHYSVDYRIGTRYMGEHIVDNFKSHAMDDPFLAELLKTDSIYIASNITFDNLAPLSTYLGKPGNPKKGGLPFKEYRRRQTLHHAAEIAAMVDTRHFIARAKSLYNYDNFVCDSSGSICEIVDPENPKDPVLKQMSDDLLLVWLEGSDEHKEELVKRFDKAPKPMCYQPEFLEKAWNDYLAQGKRSEADVDPNDFIRWTYSLALNHRQPRYRAMAENWGITVAAADAASVRDESDLDQVIATALGKG